MKDLRSNNNLNRELQQLVGYGIAPLIESFKTESLKMPIVDKTPLNGFALGYNLRKRYSLIERIIDNRSLNFNKSLSHNRTTREKDSMGKCLLNIRYPKHEDGVWVINVHGTANEKCRCGSWSNHWLNGSEQSWPDKCPEVSCERTDLVGAHVRILSDPKKRVFIVPLCNKHNSHEGRFEIDSEIKLVPACKLKCLIVDLGRIARRLVNQNHFNIMC